MTLFLQFWALGATVGTVTLTSVAAIRVSIRNAERRISKRIYGKLPTIETASSGTFYRKGPQQRLAGPVLDPRPPGPVRHQEMSELREIHGKPGVSLICIVAILFSDEPPTRQNVYGQVLQTAVYLQSEQS